MGGKLGYILVRHVFLTIGFLTLCLFFLVSGLAETGRTEAANVLAGPMRVLIVPMYVAWLLIAMLQVALIGPTALPPPFGPVVSGIALLSGLAPYMLVDYIIHRWRNSARRKRGMLDGSRVPSPRERRSEENSVQ